MADVSGVYFGPDLSESDNQFLNVTTLDDLIFQDTARTTGLNAFAAAAERVFVLGHVAGDKEAGAARAARDLRGVHIEGFGDGVLFGEIYVDIVDTSTTPNGHYGLSHDVGFITEDIDLEILIWNAYLTDSKTFTALSVTNSDGTDIDYPTLPQVITPGGEISCDLTIYQSGPAQQDTDHQFTIGGEVITTNITGIRVIAITPEPNWRSGVEITYGYHTAMHQTPRFVEQRRAMIDYPVRSAVMEYLMIGSVAHKFFYDLSYGHDKVFGVPIYSETMIPTATGLPQGDVTITLSTATASMWNLNNACDFVAIIDHENDQIEIKEISSIGANSIVCTQNIVQSFDETTSRVFPVFFGMVRAATLDQETDGVDTVRLDFVEFDNG